MEYKIPVSSPKIGEDEIHYITECIHSTWISGISPYVEKFEEEFARYCGCKYGVATNSGTTALHLALATIGVGKGDEVIIPTFTMIATVNAVSYTGAKPVLVDSEFNTWNMDVSQIEKKITERTRAIIVVHTYGHPIDMDPVLEIAEKHGLYVIEDAAEAHGAEYKGKRVGSIGHMGCFSFYANKIITTGEGGAIATNNKKLAEDLRRLRAYYFTPGTHFWHKKMAWNFRMSSIEAGILPRAKKVIPIIATPITA